MIRRMLVWVFAATLVVAWPATPGLAQSSATIPPAPVTVSQNGGYSEIAAASLGQAIDRVMGELDGFPEQTTPNSVKDATFRRRLLEMRLLMDFNAYLYDTGLMDTFRKATDESYERVGSFQDVVDIEKLLQVSVRPDMVQQRLIRMNVGLAAFRSGTVRAEFRGFIAQPDATPRTLDENDTPRLWRLAGVQPQNNLDAVGNVAWFSEKAIYGILNNNPWVNDIFDPAQEEQFHHTRKDIRSILLLLQMFPETRDLLPGVAEPLFALVNQYGDTNAGITAYRIAPRLGANTGAAAEYLRSEYNKALNRQQTVIGSRSLETLASRLAGLQGSHHR